jgi:hypothetical protein
MSAPAIEETPVITGEPAGPPKTAEELAEIEKIKPGLKALMTDRRVSAPSGIDDKPYAVTTAVARGVSMFL